MSLGAAAANSGAVLVSRLSTSSDGWTHAPSGEACSLCPVSAHCGHWASSLTQGRMDPRLALLEKLQQHPELAYDEAPGCLRVDPPSPQGFAVELRSAYNKWTVFLGEAGFHEAFTSPKEVLNFIAWCYSGEARVREVWRGRSPQKAILEAHENGEWRTVSETGFIFVPFWRERREGYFGEPEPPEKLSHRNVCFPPIPDARRPS